ANPKHREHSARRLLGAPLGEPLGEPLGTALGTPLGTTLRNVLLGEIALVFLALHHRLQGAASRLVQGIVHAVVVEPGPVVVAGRRAASSRSVPTRTARPGARL